jgi:Xaa-Pro aminopeptidase
MEELLDMPRLSLQERDRRWTKVRERMAQRDVACIITTPHTGHWEMFAAETRYLTHIGGNNSETACIFPVEAEVTAIVLNRPEFWARSQNWVTDLRSPRRHLWSQPMIDRMHEIGIEHQRVGVVGLSTGLRTPEGIAAHGIVQRLYEAFPHATFDDVTELVADVRAVKSPEEIGCLERAAEIVEAGFKAMADAARPGVPDHEVHAALYAALMRAGSEIPTMVLWGSGPPPVRDAFLPTRRPLQPGDMIANEVEAKWIGYAAQRVQPAFLGDPPKALLDAMDKQRIVFDATIERMKPGTRFGGIVQAVDDVAQEIGCRATLTLHGRGLGEDRPLLVGGDMVPEVADFVLQEGNVFVVKPNVRLPDGPAISWGDTVAVTPQGGRRLGKDRHQLLVIPC